MLQVPSAQEQREAMERALIDFKGKKCLLCLRAFKTADALEKHVEKSDLHRVSWELQKGKVELQHFVKSQIVLFYHGLGVP